MSNYTKGLLHPEQLCIELEQINPRTQTQRGHQDIGRISVILEGCRYQRLIKQDEKGRGNNTRRKLQEMPPSQPFNPNIITMNGETFKRVDNRQPDRPKPQKATIPTMLVTCYECQTVQSVPGTSSKFICGLCHTANECVPSHGILRCFNCNTKILYAKGQSQHTRCTKCRSINQVPRQIKEGWGHAIVQPVFYVNQERNPSTYAPNPYIGRDYKEYDLEELSEMQTLKYPDM